MINFVKNQLNVKAKKEINYNIIISEDIFNSQNEVILSGGKKKESRRFIIIDDFIYKLHYEKIETYFEKKLIKTKIISLPGGEANKTVANYLELFKELNDYPIDRRREPIIGIGGGVITDIVGLMASTFRGSTPHIKIPTTLMGYIDAAVQIKTGVNFGDSLNRMVCYEPPYTVILDKSFLRTLPNRHLINGIAGVLKLAVIKDSWLFEYLERYGEEGIESKFQNQPGQGILNRTIVGMVDELQANLYETVLERPLDFGHTFSPVLEVDSCGDLLHGEAVALDIAFSIVLANQLELLSDSAVDRILRLMDKLNLPYYHFILKPERLWESLLDQMRHRDGFQRVPLPTMIGGCIFINNITYENIVEACRGLEQIYRANGGGNADQRELGS
jgi:3-dehydroquinate synthetase